MALSNWQRIRNLIIDIYTTNGDKVLFDTDDALLKGYCEEEKKQAEDIILANPGSNDQFLSIKNKLSFLFRHSKIEPKIFPLPEVKLVFIYLYELNVMFHINEEQLEDRFQNEMTCTENGRCDISDK